MRFDARNRGFELGDITFWEVTTSGTFEIESSAPLVYEGSYAGKLTSHISTKLGMVKHSDRVKVGVGNIIDASIHARGVSGDTFKLGVIPYDVDGNSLSVEYIKQISLTSTYQKVQSQYVPTNIVDSISLYVYLSAATGENIAYIDSYDVHVLSVDDLFIDNRQIADLTNLTASGDTTGDKYRLYGFTDYYAEIDCSSLTGTTPTLDADVCELDQYDNEIVLGSFAQIAAGGGDERISISNPIGKGMYVKYTEGGTWTDCDFKVSVIGAR